MDRGAGGQVEILICFMFLRFYGFRVLNVFKV